MVSSDARIRPPPREPDKSGRHRWGRDRIALFFALAAIIAITLMLLLSDRNHALMPGRLASAHGTIEKCSSCHSESGSGAGTAKLSWVRGLVRGDAHTNSKSCIACHKMPETALNAHGASESILQQSTERHLPIAAKISPPLSARAQNVAFPTHDMVAGGLACATCHQEHQGSAFKLNAMSNAQCQSCHVAKFASFDSGHPEFENYPFRRRTRIIYDHDAHFSKHYPEVAKKTPEKRIPETCSTCHDSRGDRRLMSVAPFDKTCATCHLDQIVGKERAAGPKGVAFLTLPGMDVQSLKSKNAVIGEWPDVSDTTLTPFMIVMIARTERGKAVLNALEKVNLQDLSQTNADGVKAATDLVWEVKTIIRDLIAGKTADVLGNLNIARGAKLSASLVADLTANIPRDVLISAQQQWLPNLANELAHLTVSGDRSGATWTLAAMPPVTASKIDALSRGEAADAETEADAEDKKTASPPEEAENTEGRATKSRLDPPACTLRVLGQCLISKEPSAGVAVEDDQSSSAERPPAMRAGLADLAAINSPHSENAKRQQLAANEVTHQGSKDDDLLRPTPAEQREIDDRRKRAGREISPTASGPAEGAPAPLISIDSSIDPESWAEAGGWYRQDYAILYRPSGHKDKFIYSWLFLSGPKANKGDATPTAAVFDSLTGKDAQGACTKCHSVDDLQGKGRIVNFAPASMADKNGRFTTFVHEPHFGTVEKEGCLTCHGLEKGRPYLKNYELGNPQTSVSTFGHVKKELCQKCHVEGAARQDCLTCHKYHVNGSVTPITRTTLPTQ